LSPRLEDCDAVPAASGKPLQLVQTPRAFVA